MCEETDVAKAGVCDQEAQDLPFNSQISELYHAHFERVSGMIRRTFGDGPPDPDDVTQQAFQKLMERTTVSDIANPVGFLWRSARNLTLSALKSQNVRSKYDYEIEQLYFPGAGVNSTPEAVYSMKEELRAINEALRAMPVKRRRAFLLHRVEGLSVSEVARRLNISRSPADRHIIRATEDIQVCLARLKGTEDS